MPRPRLGRYSRSVRVLRIGLPLIALALMSMVFLIEREDFAAGFRFSAADFAALDDGLRLVEPRFTGTTEKGEPFIVRAEWALPDSPDPEVIELHAIRAELTMRDSRLVTVVAREGVLKPKAQTVRLKGRIVLTTSDGYRAETEEALADLKSRSLTTAAGVVAEGPLGRIEAGRLRAFVPDRARTPDRDEVIVFENGVRVVYRPAAAPAAPETGGDR